MIYIYIGEEELFSLLIIRGDLRGFMFFSHGLVISIEDSCCGWWSWCGMAARMENFIAFRSMVKAKCKRCEHTIFQRLFHLPKIEEW